MEFNNPFKWWLCTKDKVEFRVVLHTDKVEGGYHLTTIDQAKGNMERVKDAYKSSEAFQEKQKVRLKNGFLYHGDDTYHTFASYEEGIKYKLINNLKRGDQKPQTLSKEDCLIALAYAAQHDDVEEAVELVKDAGPEILSTPMPFAYFGTILHVCAEWSSLQTLHKVVTDYPTSLDVLIRDRDGDTALHNIPNMRVEKSYDDCKRAARCLLGLAGVHANKLLAIQNDYGEMTALCKALVFKKLDASKALLDAAKEHVDSIRASQPSDAANMEEHEENSATNKAEQYWLALSARGRYINIAYQRDLQYADESGFCTALHLAVLQRSKDIVTQILAYPGAKEIGLPSCLDHDGSTPLHVAAKLGNQDICSVLLEYGASLSLKDKRGRYALTNAYEKGNIEAVKKLLDAYLSENKGKHSTTTSAETGHNAALVNAKSAGSSLSVINMKLGLGLTSLHVAVAISSESHIKDLIKAGAFVDSASDDDRTPLHVAAQHSKRDTLVGLLLGDSVAKLRKFESTSGTMKSWINMQDNSGKTALHNVVRLLSHSREDNSVEGGGKMSDTDERSHTEIISEEGSDTQMPPRSAESINKVCDVVKLLLEKGAWVDVQDCSGETPLHEAARTHLKLVETLLSATNPSNFKRDHVTESRLDDLLRVIDTENKTALDWAALENRWEIVNAMITRSDIKPITRKFLMWHLKVHFYNCHNRKENEHIKDLKKALLSFLEVEKGPLFPSLFSLEGEKIKLVTKYIKLAVTAATVPVTSLLKTGAVEEGDIVHRARELVNQGDQKPQTLSKEDCLIALAYEAQLDDVEEVVELVKDAGPQILSTPMPFACLGTILHFCTDWSRLQTLEKVVTDYPTSLDVFIRDRDGDTALHNIPNMRVKKSYGDCKRAAGYLLDLAGVRANKLLAIQNNYGGMTALCKALLYRELDASKAILDAAKERVDAANMKENKENLATNKHWLASTVNVGQFFNYARDEKSRAWQYADESAFCTALHLAVLRGFKDIVTKILAYPGAEEVGLPSCPDQNGRTPLHVAAKLGNQDICSVLLEYIGVAVNKDEPVGVNSRNKDGETPLHVAATSGRAEVCEKLLQYGASLSLKDERGRYALTNAYEKGDNEAVKKLLDAYLSENKGTILCKCSESQEGWGV